MYDYVSTMGKTEKRPVFGTQSSSDGTVTISSATYEILDNEGTSVDSGTATDFDTGAAAERRAWELIDAAALSFASGVYLVSITINSTRSDGLTETTVSTIVLFIPGPVTRTIYPTAADLQVFLSRAGLIGNPPTEKQALIDLDSAIGEAVKKWEKMTGYQPFLADADDSSWPFDGNGTEIVDLDGGFVSLTSVTYRGTAQVLNTDYRPMPQNAVNLGKPYTYLKMRCGVIPYYPTPAGAGQVVVVGKRGYAEVLPEDAWNAVLLLAAVGVVPELETAKLSSTGGIVIRRKESDEETQYSDPMKSGGGGFYSSQSTAWQQKIDKTLNSGYRRPRIA